MRKAYSRIGIALVCACLLAGCDNSKGSATPEAALQFHELQAEIATLAQAEWMAEAMPQELTEVVQHFIETADPTHISATGKYSILHLACMLKKPELTRCLLIDGANPNAASETEEGPAETPLLFALATDYAPDVPAATINKLIDVLVAGGASLATPGSAETSVTYNACLTCAYEEVYAHLLDIGAPRTGNETEEAAYRGWLSTLKRLVAEKGGIQAEDYPLLTLVARMGGGYYEGEHLACAEYLLAQGVPVDAADDAGRTALFWLASTLPSLPEDEGLRNAALELAAYLLQQGADPTLRADKDPEYPGFSPAELLALNPQNIADLRAKGIELPTVALSIRAGEQLAADVCRAAMLPLEASEIAPHFDTIAQLLNPIPSQQQQELFADALKNAIVLLAEADAGKAAELVAASPLWQNHAVADGHSHILPALVSGMQDSAELVLPAEFLLSTAEKMLQIGEHSLAASLVEMIGRCEGVEDLLEQLCNDSRPAIRAGAKGGKLYQLGLPEACDGAVAAWLAAQQRQADTPALQKALLLTSIEDLWYGNMSREQVEAFVNAAAEVGAPNAAKAYRAIADNLSNPEELDLLMSTQEEWMYELEIATADYMIAHKDEILPPGNNP